jgi:putative thioredoxin
MTSSPHIADVTQQTFESQVLARSREIPVLVDFWAAWCGPCKMLMPVLTKLAEDYRGKFFLAKVNSDAEQALAQRYAVKSLPTVKLFRNGQVVDEFMGAQPEKTIRALLDRHIPRESDALVANALLTARAGQYDEALVILTNAMNDDPANDRAILERARLLAHLGRSDESEQTLKALSGDVKDSSDATAIRAQIEFARIVKDARRPDELLKTVTSNPKDSAARFQLAAHLVLRQQFEAALEQLLEIVRIDRKFNDDAARKAMLSVFQLMGGSGELVTQYRRKLSMILN